MTTTLTPPRTSRSVRAHRRVAHEAVRLTLDALHANDYTAHTIRGFRSRSVFVILPDASQAVITVKGEGQEVVVQHSYGRNTHPLIPGVTVPAELTSDSFTVAGYVSACELTRAILSRLSELRSQKEGAHRDLPYKTLGSL